MAKIMHKTATNANLSVISTYKKKRRYTYACFYSATMFTSKIITETIMNFLGAQIAANFVKLDL